MHVYGSGAAHGSCNNCCAAVKDDMNTDAVEAGCCAVASREAEAVAGFAASWSCCTDAIEASTDAAATVCEQTVVLQE